MVTCMKENDYKAKIEATASDFLTKTVHPISVSIYYKNKEKQLNQE